jgi:hypothetical protein
MFGPLAKLRAAVFATTPCIRCDAEPGSPLGFESGNRRHRVLTVSSVHTTMIGQRHGAIVYKEASRVRVIG